MVKPFEFTRAYRHAIAQDFVSSSGEPYAYAPGGLRRWGEESHHIQTSATPDSVAVRRDGTIAVAIARDIHIYNSTYDLIKTLHVPEAPRSLLFQPGPAGQLLTFSDDYQHEPSILLWDLSAADPQPGIDAQSLSTIITAATTQLTTDLSSHHINLSPSSVTSPQENLTDLVDRTLAQHTATHHFHLSGRLALSFGANPSPPPGPTSSTSPAFVRTPTATHPGTYTSTPSPRDATL
ncbi:hypothetical protein CAC42_5167 [Sphaceloma murrayae]|uniref:Uncharacterized protein n=1 Tax=Sphaceloma murrayae TaxID=2082308 RepID=A0A2K1QU84_9PEZI|nr:hypothetical protein CAC42_5167 [Sphaceloma murrayae]